MDCCKETKYNLLLLKDNFNQKSQIVEGLKKSLSWSTINAESAYDHAQMTGKFKLSDGTSEKMIKISSKLAEYSIPHQLIMSKKQ